MKIPNKLKIGGHIYDVICPYSFTERGDRSGDCDSISKIIRIDTKDCWSHRERKESGVAVTFLHEVLHACDYLTGHEMFIGEEGEKRISALSESLFQVLRDNKLKFYEEETIKTLGTIYEKKEGARREGINTISD